MPVPRIEDIRDRRGEKRLRARLKAEWYFVKVCFTHFRRRLLLMALILLGGATLFRAYEPEKEHSLAQATYYTYSLIFGEPPEEFPRSLVLQGLFFIVPILGLTVIIEGIVDFALILRDRRRFEKSWCIMLASSFSSHVVLVGLGRLGFRIFNTLRRLDVPLVVIERDAANEFLDEVRRDGSPLLIGDARREALLEDANVGAARSIILATNDDLANLEAALDARKINPSVRVVMRMFDQNMADKVREAFNIHLAISQAAMSAPTFATSALAPATVNSVIVGDQLVSMQRWLVRLDGPLCGLTVAEAMRTHRIGIVEHRRPPGEPAICPDPDTRLEPGDGLMLQGPIERLESLRRKSVERVSATS